ncbi:uncharacterized protein F4812DRAFT_454418 [Daldinia caldariorum]|uniref:uncharacterized protein n=1 Tax=Daldinia caldariorum TaxID=326644 RepID=UPI0020079B82|nr:uncharacterized protein F4812DRAFT_454418 [Daldinia caldariorum]KAI1472603.1 hypothetical protein F4812DRAFT_454418 [Daldinia caldariorum]
MVFTVNLVDQYGRRKSMLWGSGGLTVCYVILALIAMNFFPTGGAFKSVVGTVTLVGSTSIFGVFWLTTVWLIPTELHPDKAWTYWLFAVFVFALYQPFRGFADLALLTRDWLPR